MENLYKFQYDFNYGVVEGLFLAEESEIQKITGTEICFGEVLGKHSDIFVDIEEDDFEKIKISKKAILELKNIFGNTISGYNPFDYIYED